MRRSNSEEAILLLLIGSCGDVSIRDLYELVARQRAESKDPLPKLQRHVSAVISRLNKSLTKIKAKQRVIPGRLKGTYRLEDV